MRCSLVPDCSFMMEYDIHTVLDLLTLIATAWVIYMLRGPLKDSYQAELDNLNHLFVVRGLGVALLPIARDKP